MFAPDDRLLVGLEEDDNDGSLRVYLGVRYTDIHTHVDDPDAKDRLRHAWAAGPHTIVTVPAAALCNCPTQPGSETP